MKDEERSPLSSVAALVVDPRRDHHRVRRGAGISLFNAVVRHLPHTDRSGLLGDGRIDGWNGTLPTMDLRRARCDDGGVGRMHCLHRSGALQAQRKVGVELPRAGRVAVVRGRYVSLVALRRDVQRDLQRVDLSRRAGAAAVESEDDFPKGLASSISYKEIAK